MNLKLSSSATGTRNVAPAEQGGGQYLLERNIFAPAFTGNRVTRSSRTYDKPAASSCEYYGMDGMYDFVPYDLNAMGAPGQAIAAVKGRYVWIISSDHPMDDAGEEGGWGRDAKSIYAAFTDDPCVYPDPMGMRRIINYVIPPPPGTPGTSYTSGFNHCLVYNPDDATNPFYLYTGSWNANGTGTTGIRELLHYNNDFDSEFTAVSESHPTTSQGITAYQRVVRLGTNDWVSIGGWDPTVLTGQTGKWISTDGQNFTRTGSFLTPKTIGNRQFLNAGTTSFKTYINGQAYSVTNETDAVLGGLPGNSGAYATLVAVDDSTGNILSSPAPIRVSAAYDGVFPVSFSLAVGDGFIQTTPSYEENGILFVYVLHNYAADVGLEPAASYRDKLPENGGGTNEQYVDVYGYPIPGKEADAANSAPFGAKASCDAGVVTLSWYDPPGGRTFRTKRYASLANANSDTSGTSVGDVTGTSITDNPTAGSVYYWRVTALNGASEEGFRIVCTYVS